MAKMTTERWDLLDLQTRMQIMHMIQPHVQRVDDIDEKFEVIADCLTRDMRTTPLLSSVGTGRESKVN